jgi:hypothetical protein
MEFENFDFKKMEVLTIQEQKNYFIKFFVPLSNGSHCMMKNGQYEMITDEVLNKVYLKRCGKKIREYYLEDYKEVKTPVYKLNKPLMYEDKINLCPQLRPIKPYKDFDKSIKAKVNIYLSYLKEIIASNNEDVFQYILKWNANVCKGNKNDTALVFKTNSKGVGKSTHPTMMRKYILGENLCLETGSEPLKSKFNNILGGKLFVYFEELETFSSNEWIGVSCVLKRQITSDIITLQKKGQDAFEVENLNNYILLSNHDVDDDGRRFFVADIATHRKGDYDYWDNLYKNCFNDEVGFALYCYFSEIDTKSFKPQQFPITKNKLNSISKRLDSVYLFLKERYILENKSIYERLKELYLFYKEYCISINKRPCGKTDFTSKLSEIQINHYWSNGYNRYKVDIQDLKKIADKNNWINETDEFEVVPEVFIEEDETNELKNQIKSLKQQILDLQSQIEEKNLELEILK